MSLSSFHLFGLKAALVLKAFQRRYGYSIGVHDWLLRLSAEFLQEYEYSYHREQVP